MAKVTVTESSLENIADAIRAKLGVATEYKPGEMAAAIQSIPTGGSAVLEHLSVTQNGTYTPGAGVDGFDQVTVNVSGGGGEDWTSLKNYIESSGTQWIDTGYIPNSNSRFECVASISSTQAIWATLLGAREAASANAKSCWIAVRNNGSQYMTFNWGFYDTSGLEVNFYSNVKSRYRFYNSGYDATGEDAYTGSGQRFVGNSVTNLYPIYIFTLDQGGSDFGSGTHCNMKLYRLRIYEGDAMIHEFVPWQENGVACLKDTVTSEIKYNAGTGNFVYGTDS